MKTKNAKLVFGKSSIIELNESTMLDIDGGTTPICIGAGVSSGPCAVAAAAALAAVGNAMYNWVK